MSDDLKSEAREALADQSVWYDPATMSYLVGALLAALQIVEAERDQWMVPGAEVREEWEVTGQPDGGYPPYRFVFGNPYESLRVTDPDDPEGRARQFITSATAKWSDVKLRSHRSIVTPWINEGVEYPVSGDDE